MPDPSPESTESASPSLELPLAVHRRPVALLADSQLLFWEGPGGGHFVERLRPLAGDAPRAAYVGASNGDQPEYFELFAAALDRLDAVCRLVPAQPSTADRAFFDDADLIFLAGGDPVVGWRALTGNGLAERLRPRWDEGALLMGLSAGAMQLGLRCWSRASEGGSDEIEEAAGLLPFLIDAHDDPEWLGLRRHLPALGSTVGGLGIPAGGGALVHPDMTVEPVRKPLAELFVHGEEVRQSLLMPGDAEGDPPARIH